MEKKRTMTIGAAALLAVLVCGGVALAIGRANASQAEASVGAELGPDQSGKRGVPASPDAEYIRRMKGKAVFGESGRSPLMDEASRERSRRFAEEIAPAEEHNKTAERLLKEGDLAGAEREAKLAVDQGPRLKDGESFGPFLERLGDVRLAQGRYEDALSLYARARKSTGGDDLETNVLICRAKLGRITLAEGLAAVPKIRDYYEEWCKNMGEPRNAREAAGYVMWLRGTQLCFYGNDFLDQAMYWLDRAATALPHNASLAFMRARTAKRLNNWDKAVRCYETAIRYGDETVRVWSEREIYTPKRNAGLLHQD